MMKNLLFRDYPAAPPMLREPIPPAIRGRLEARLALLKGRLAPIAKSEHPKVSKAIGGLLGAFPAASGGSPDMVVARYLQVLESLPAWAIDRACQMLERGQVEGANLDFRPSAPRVYEVARGLLAPWLEEMFYTREVLEAPALKPEDAPMRERVSKLMAEFVGQMRSKRFSGTAHVPSKT